MQLPFREAGRRRSSQGERSRQAAADRFRHLRHEDAAQATGKVFGNFLTVYLIFGEIVNLLWQLFMLLGKSSLL